MRIRSMVLPLIAAAEASAKGKAGTGVIAVVDAGGNLMAVERLDNTFAAGANISIGKARTAALFRKPTKVFWGDEDGRTLYLAASTGIYRIRLVVAGAGTPATTASR